MMGQEISVPFYCPRCGGPMYQPAGSAFYWHATNNHPPCGITSIVEIPKSTSANNEPPSELSKGQPIQKNVYS